MARKARQQSRRPSKFLSHFYGPKRNHRAVKFASKRSVSVYHGFPSRCTLNCNRIEPAAKKKDKERLIAGLTIGRKLQLKCKFSFVIQCSFANKFSRPWAFFLHEQRVSLRLPLSVLSNIIISWNEQFFVYLFIPFSPTKKVISRRNISVTDVTNLQNVQPLSLATIH